MRLRAVGCLLAALASTQLAFAAEPDSGAQQVALTFDDLPWSGTLSTGETAEQGIERIAAVLRVHDARATGFVICDAATDPAPLRQWIGWGFGLGNHSAAHRDLNQTPVADWLGDARRCDTFLRRFGAAYDHSFRFPMLHQGKDPAIRDAARSGLLALGLHLAPVSIDTSDWILARAYDAALASRDAGSRQTIAHELVRHVLAATDHADAVARRKLGRSLPHVLLLHASTLMADHLDALLLALRQRGVRFVSLADALADPAYARDDEYIGARGVSWLYRMAPATPEDARWDDAEAAAVESRIAPGAPAAAPVQITSRFRAPAAPAQLDRAIDMAAASERMHAFVVMQRGQVLAEAYFNGWDAERPENLKSVTKTLVSSLVGLAIDRGRIHGLDDTLARLLPERFASGGHADKAQVTLRHLLTMTSGLPAVDYDAFQHSPDWVEALLAGPVTRPPATVFEYDTPQVHLVSAILTHALGESPLQLANRELLAPLGATVGYWRSDPQGVPMGGNDAYMRPRDLIRLGELYRLGGAVGGKRLLSAEYVRTSLSALIMPPEPTVNHGTLNVRGYGLFWWLLDEGGEEAFAALGHGGQEMLVFPRRELVVLMTSRWPGASSVPHYVHLARVLREGILPAFPLPAAPPRH